MAEALDRVTRVASDHLPLLADLQARQPAIQARMEAVHAAYVQARQTLQHANQHVQRRSLERERGQLMAQSQAIDDQVGKAGQVQTELNALRAQRQGQPIEAKVLKFSPAKRRIAVSMKQL